MNMVVIHLKTDAPTVLTSGRVEIDLTKQIVKVKGRVVNLNEEEYDIVLLMARHHLL